MRAVLLVVAGCGRIGFDPLSQPPPTGDAPIDVAAAKPVYLTQQFPGVTSELYEIDLATAKITLVGMLPTTAGELDALAAIDSNTLLVAAFDGTLSLVTLSPFGLAPQSMLGSSQFVGAVNDGGTVRILDRSSNSLCTIVLSPFDFSCMPISGGLTVEGGGLTVRADGALFLWTNTAPVGLWTIDPSTAAATRVLPGEPSPEEIIGVVFDGEVLFGAARSSNELIEISTTTGQYGTRTSLTLDGIDFGLEFGDVTRGL